MEENNLLTETHQNAKKELQTVVLQLEGQLKEQKSNEDALKAEIEILKTEIDEKSVLKDRLKELEKQLAIAEARVKEEVIKFIVYKLNQSIQNYFFECSHWMLI